MSGNLWRKIATDVTINRHKGRSYRQDMPLKLAKKRKTAIAPVAASDLRALGFYSESQPFPAARPPESRTPEDRSANGFPPSPRLDWGNERVFELRADPDLSPGAPKE